MSWTLSLEEILAATGGKCLSTGVPSFSGVSTDTRKDCQGKLFIALKGEVHDAHLHLDKAVQAGATGLLVHQDVQHPGLTVVRVPDTLKALQDLGHFWRKKCRAKIVGITGTNGKTTTKDFAHTLISAKYRTVCTQGNLNNYIGLPLSLLQMDNSTEVGVFEMGLSVPGEMATLGKIGEPDVSVVTSVGRAHLEGLGTLEDVAMNKEQIYSFSRADGIRVLNLDNPYTKKMKDKFPRGSKILTYSSEDPEATVCFREALATLEYLEITGTIQGEPGSARVPIFGRHNISNLMAAAALALAVGVEPKLIWQTLPKCRGYWGRNQIVKLKSGASVLFDAYNANPESVEAMIKNISRIKPSGKVYAFFGDMLELGPQSGDYHRAWGEMAATLGLEGVWFVGAQASEFKSGLQKAGFRKNIVISDAYKDSLAAEVRNVLNPSDILLVKGSRGMKLERVVLQLDPVEFSGLAKS